MSAQRHEGKVAMITGAARGQGRAHCVRLASEGARIVAIDACSWMGTPGPPSTRADLDATVEEVRAAGGDVIDVVADVRDLAALRGAVGLAVDRFGRLDIVIANAGIVHSGYCWQMSEREWTDVIDVNLTGAWKTVAAAVPVMVEQGSGGSIILVSSVAGLKGLPFFGAYSASKHGLVGLCGTLANELGAHRIRVNSIHPGAVDTLMVTGDHPFHGLIEQHAATLGPIFGNALPGDALQPHDVSSLVSFLASDESWFMTGTHVPADLGSLAR